MNNIIKGEKFEEFMIHVGSPSSTRDKASLQYISRCKFHLKSRFVFKLGL